MSIPIISADNQKKGTVTLPAVFNEAVRADLIKRAFAATASGSRQAYGADNRAGKKASSTVSRRRRKYRGAYGKGISRVSRKIMSRRGSQMNWVGAGHPGTVGGYRAFPPVPEKIWAQKINDKERKKALRSALAATTKKELVQGRGHKLPRTFPFILDSDFEKLASAKDVKAALAKLELMNELDRTKDSKIAAGIRKMRGHARKTKVGPLLVVGKNCPLLAAARNIPGVDVCVVKRLSVAQLAPGAHLARLTLFTKDAIDSIEKEKLFQ